MSRIRMYNVVNLTDIHTLRCFVLYAKELSTIDESKIRKIIFGDCSVTVLGDSGPLLEVKDGNSEPCEYCEKLDECDPDCITHSYSRMRSS